MRVHNLSVVVFSIVVLVVGFDVHFLPLHCLADCCIAAQFLPHLLEGGVVLRLFGVVGPLQLVLVLCLVQHVPPILLLEVVLHLLDVLVGLVEHVDGLDKRACTSALSCCISTSSSFWLTSLSLTSPFSIIFCRSFLAFRRGMSSFLLPVSLKAGTLSAMLPSICARSLFLALMKFLMVSLAFLSLNFTSSTFCISYLLGACSGRVSFLGLSLKQNQVPIKLASKQQQQMWISELRVFVLFFIH